MYPKNPFFRGYITNMVGRRKDTGGSYKQDQHSASERPR